MRRHRWQLWFGIAIILCLVVIAFLLNPGWLAVIRQAFSPDSIQSLADYLRGFGILAPLISLALMVLQAVIAPLPSSLIAGANGIIFGLWWGTLLSWGGNVLGASVSFWMARWLGRDAVARWVHPRYLTQVDALSERHGFGIVLAARLTPIISLDFIGYLAGMSRMKFRDYTLANIIGLAPGMFAYTMLGNDLASAEASIWRVSLILLGGLVLYLAGRWWLRRQWAEIDLGA